MHIESHMILVENFLDKILIDQLFYVLSARSRIPVLRAGFPALFTEENTDKQGQLLFHNPVLFLAHSYRSESTGLDVEASISFLSVFNSVNKDFLVFIIDSV